MELRSRTSHLARPAAITAVLGALLALVAGTATADAATAKKKRYPVVTSISPMNAKVGDTISIRGRYFKRGKNKNTVVFKRDGARAVFAKSTLGTAKLIRVVVPDSLRPFLTENSPARVRVRILAERFGKAFTPAAKSPMITALPKPAGSTGTGTGTGSTGGSAPAPAAAVCTGDQDGDMLSADLENTLGLDACKADSDGDAIPDGYEYQSARDLNDDEFQETNQSLPYPGKRPYPNPLFKDSDVDYDGDGLRLLDEYRLWDKYGARPAGVLPRDDYRLLYSDGEQYSLSTRAGGTGRRTPSQPAVGYAKGDQFLAWASSAGYNPVQISKTGPWHDASTRESYDIRDLDLDHAVSASEASLYDDGDGWLSDDERDEDADGLTNIDELRSRMTSEYWKGCYVNEKPFVNTYAGTDLTDPDSDGDGVRDGADDQDHDDLPNIMELSRFEASGGLRDWDSHDGTCHVSDAIPTTVPDGPDPDDLPDPLEDWHPGAYGRVNPYNPCLPFAWARTCPSFVEFSKEFAPFDSSTTWFSLQ